MGERIDRLVEDLLRFVGIPPAPPIPLEKIAHALGVREIIECELLEEGRLERNPEVTRILLNQSVSPQRRRFTLAHELAHLLLAHPHTPVTARRTYPNLNDEERFCDSFAASLLLPARWLRTQYQGSPPSLASLRQVANTADTSLSATAVRMNTLLAWNRALLRWRSDGSAWRLASSAGVPKSLHGLINTAPGTSTVLTFVPANATSCVALPLLVQGRSKDFPAEVWVSRYRRSAIALVESGVVGSGSLSADSSSPL